MGATMKTSESNTNMCATGSWKGLPVQDRQNASKADVSTYKVVASYVLYPNAN